MEKEYNKWKIAFVSLITSLALIAIALITFVLYYLPVSMEHSVDDVVQPSGESRFVVSTTKENLQFFIDEQLSQDGSHLNIFLSDYVTLTAEVPFLGSNIPFQLDLEPQLYGDGNLLLTEQAFRIGQLQIPSDTLFQLISRTLDLPEWIKIDATEGKIFLYITNIETFNHLFIKVKAFDLKENKIEFELVSK